MQLVINTFGASLRTQGDRFLIQAGDKKFAVSAHKVQSILLTTGAHLSTDAIELAHVHNIDLVFLDKFGDPFARTEKKRTGPVMLEVLSSFFPSALRPRLANEDG
jgi:CRISPR-associated protein Cas1